VTVQDDTLRSGGRGADGEARSWAELRDLAVEHGVDAHDFGGPGLAEMVAALGPAPDD
jgi:hypothetical protein